MKLEGIKGYFYAKSNLGIIEGEIIKRIGEIIDVLYNEFKLIKPKGWIWYFAGAEGGMGQLELREDYEYIDYIIDCEVHSKAFGDYAYRIPVTFLTMSDEEIIEFVRREFNIRQATAKEKKKKAAIAKEKRDAKRQEAINRLSLEDRKALGIK